MPVYPEAAVHLESSDRHVSRGFCLLHSAYEKYFSRWVVARNFVSEIRGAAFVAHFEKCRVSLLVLLPAKL